MFEKFEKGNEFGRRNTRPANIFLVNLYMRVH